MIKFVIAAVFSVGMLQAQTDEIKNQVEVGDVFQIGRPGANEYKHIDFPRANFIIKKGGIANYKKVEGNYVVVTSVKQKKDGSTEIKIKRNDGGQFFGTHTQVTADYNEAMEAGELRAK